MSNEPTEETPARAPTLASGLRARIAEAVRFHPREATALGVLGLLLLIGAGVAYVRARPVSAQSVLPSGTISASASPLAAAASIVVHVVGAVHAPGVYTFTQGMRVIDAVKAAGGFTREADAQSINLARALTDGEQIVVPRKGEAQAPATGAQGGGGGSGGAAQGGKLNINSASASDFEKLPGIGPVLAQKIVDYRDQHGPFQTVKDLMKVSGIGPKKFESLEPYVTV